jgi:hypothetical protein
VNDGNIGSVFHAEKIGETPPGLLGVIPDNDDWRMDLLTCLNDGSVYDEFKAVRNSPEAAEAFKAAARNLGLAR